MAFVSKYIDLRFQLLTVSEHNFDFQKESKNIANEILNCLNTIELPNIEYLRKSVIYQLEQFGALQSHPIDSLEEFKKTVSTLKWKLDFSEDNFFHFTNSLGIGLTFYNHLITFSQPLCLYYKWLESSSKEHQIYRREWRRYIQTILHAIGSKKVIYLPHHYKFLYEIISEDLAEVLTIEKISIFESLDELIHVLKMEYPNYLTKTSFETVYKKMDRYIMLDSFNDIPPYKGIFFKGLNDEDVDIEQLLDKCIEKRKFEANTEDDNELPF